MLSSLADFALKNYKILLVFGFLSIFIGQIAFILGFFYGIVYYFFNMFCYIGVSANSIDLVVGWSEVILLFRLFWKLVKIFLSHQD